MLKHVNLDLMYRNPTCTGIFFFVHVQSNYTVHTVAIGNVLYARSVALSSAPPLFSSSVPCLTTYRSTGSDTFPDVRV